MEQDTTQPDGFSWTDPHAFHHDVEGHADDHGHGHVTSWQKLVTVLFMLLFLTALTVAAANTEAWAVGMGIHITHFWNVIIALTIALAKATLVCMFFMHLKYDNPLHTMILLTTLFIFGLFLLFTGIDVNERGVINPYKDGQVLAGGTGVGMVYGGGNLGTNITTARKLQEIERRAVAFAATHDRDTPNDEDQAEAEADFWNEFYHHKLEDHHGRIPIRHPDDVNDHHAQWLTDHIEKHGGVELSDGNKSRQRQGLTAGLFDEHDPHAGHGEAVDHAESEHRDTGVGPHQDATVPDGDH